MRDLHYSDNAPWGILASILVLTFKKTLFSKLFGRDSLSDNQITTDRKYSFNICLRSWCSDQICSQPPICLYWDFLESGRVHARTRPWKRTVYTAVYTACTVSEHGRTHGQYRACTRAYDRVYSCVHVNTARTQPWKRRVYIRVHGRLRAGYTAVYVYGTCTLSCTRPCTRPCTRVQAVYTVVYTAYTGRVQGVYRCIRPCTRPCIRPCTGRVH